MSGGLSIEETAERVTLSAVYPFSSHLKFSKEHKHQGYLHFELPNGSVKFEAAEGRNISANYLSSLPEQYKKWFDEKYYLINNHNVTGYVEFKIQSKKPTVSRLGALFVSASADSKYHAADWTVLQAAVNRFVFCANLSQLNSFDVSNGLVAMNGEPLAISFAPRFNFDSAARYQRNSGLNLIISEPFTVIDTWTRQIMSAGNEDPIKRAFGYWNRCSKSNDDGSGVIWAVAGIEAILGEKDSIVRTIKAKLNAIFGDVISRHDIEGLFDSIYRIRSKIVHGETPIIVPFSDGDTIKLNDKKFESYDEAFGFSSLIILSIFQWCAKRSLRSLNFSLSVEQRP